MTSIGSRNRRLAGKARVRARRRARRAQNGEGRLGGGNPTHALVAAPAAPSVALFGLRELEGTTLPNLRALAKGMNLKGYSKLPKGELVEFLYRSEENTRG